MIKEIIRKENVFYMKSLITRKLKSAANYVKVFLKWILISIPTGIIGGLIGTAFSYGITYANKFNTSFEWAIFLLPVGGVLIVLMYKAAGVENDPGTNLVIESIRSKKSVPWFMAPLIFFGTIITHLVGGSAGREGAALQLGGSLGSLVGKVLHLDEKDMHIAIMCGMSGLFSSLFCTPITAAFFALEVISVGVAYYSALVPCFVSGIVSYYVAVTLGISPMRYDIEEAVPSFDIAPILQVVGLAAACAVISIVFCVAVEKAHIYAKKLLPNEFIRVLAGAGILIFLTLLVNCRDYNGAGSQVIANALTGNAKPEAFALKIIFTAVTIGCGFKGGEIVPTLFIGSTFGCVFGSLLGIDPAFAAAVGMISLFCGVVNCPIASIIMSVEIFGSSGLIFFALASGVAYMLSGYYGLYSSQKILYSKLKAEFININAK